MEMTEAQAKAKIVDAARRMRDAKQYVVLETSITKHPGLNYWYALGFPEDPPDINLVMFDFSFDNQDNVWYSVYEHKQTKCASLL